jgi:ribosomal-protein-alanine N-acetyltransferase
VADSDGTIRLIAAHRELLDIEDRSIAALCAMLGVAEPANWPPLFNGPETRDWFREEMRKAPASFGWWGFYILAVIDDVERLAGTAGYKGPPDAEGCVEIGYSVVDAYHRRGIASRTVHLLVARAFRHPGVRVVIAQTLPDAVASQGVLRKTGFDFDGTRLDPDDGEVHRFTRHRTA